MHSFAGIGSGEAGLKRCLELASRSSAAQTWRKCKRLIIDEISMVDGEFFEVLYKQQIEPVVKHSEQTKHFVTENRTRCPSDTSQRQTVWWHPTDSLRRFPSTTPSNKGYIWIITVRPNEAFLLPN